MPTRGSRGCEAPGLSRLRRVGGAAAGDEVGFPAQGGRAALADPDEEKQAKEHDHENAAKHGPEGGIRVAVAGPEEREESPKRADENAANDGPHAEPKVFLPLLLEEACDVIRRGVLEDLPLPVVAQVLHFGFEVFQRFHGSTPALIQDTSRSAGLKIGSALRALETRRNPL